MNGFYNINKPTGLTSSDVVGRIRRITGVKRVGHLGTLDPGAAGVLPIAVSKCARLFDFLTEKQKSYRAEFVFGVETDTLDAYGKITAIKPFSGDENEVKACLRQFIGKIKQLPPAYSALSVNGVRAYDLARKGEAVELQPRQVEVFDFSLVQKTENGFIFDISCGRGTYIRSLARDLAYSLDTIGYMSMLIRTSSGMFKLCDSYTLEEIEKDPTGTLLPADYPLMALEKAEFNARDGFKLLNGIAISGMRMDNRPRRVYIENEFVGLGEATADGFKLTVFLKED
ncbi:MAG: tRNA pseudouridine(55) synthase TruB [Clostridia bacterium]|nr:tRNA pseudouridine(55) synthase TruB [Clostridia bacterium]